MTNFYSIVSNFDEIMTIQQIFYILLEL